MSCLFVTCSCDPAVFYTSRFVLRGVLFNWRPQDMTTSALHMRSCPIWPLEKGVGSIYSVSVGFRVDSFFLRLPFRRRRRGRYVAYVSPRLAFLVALVLRACGRWVLHAHACGGWWFLSVLSLWVLSLLLFLPVPLFCFFLSPSSASASGKPDNLLASIWGGRLLLFDIGGLVGYML